MQFSRHIRGKSDTDFFTDKQYLDNIHYNIKSFKSPIRKNKKKELDTLNGNRLKTKRKIIINSIFRKIYLYNKSLNKMNSDKDSQEIKISQYEHLKTKKK